MYATTALFALLATSAFAAPVVEQRGDSAPSDWAWGYLENYDTYHSRYLDIGCSGKQGSDFFNACCSPILASETLEQARAPYCIPSSEQSGKGKESDDDNSKDQWKSTGDNQEKKKKEKESKGNNGPSGDVKTGGHATYFHQNGRPGACGNYNSDSDYLVAIDGNGYWQNYGQKSDYCGRWVNIKNTQNGKTVTAKVQDVCPTCISDNSLDLSVAAFEAIASKSQGLVPIEWSFA